MDLRISEFLVGCVGALIPQILHWHRIAVRVICPFSIISLEFRHSSAKIL
jgi:hypothetical protein